MVSLSESGQVMNTSCVAQLVNYDSIIEIVEMVHVLRDLQDFIMSRNIRLSLVLIIILYSIILTWPKCVVSLLARVRAVCGKTCRFTISRQRFIEPYILECRGIS